MNKQLWIVEDDPDDQYMIRKALEPLNTDIDYHYFDNGQEAIDELMSTDALPQILVVDLNMPYMDGFELIERIRSSRHYAHIPVIVFTTSSSETDIQKAYKLGADAFVVKPMQQSDTKNIFAKIIEFWFSPARLN